MAGTQISVSLPEPSHGDTAQCRTRAIEDIAAGDLVLACDPATGAVSLKRVDEVYRRIADVLCVVTVASESAGRQTLKTTPDHPFWVCGKGWTNAGDLASGDTLQGPSREQLNVLDVQRNASAEGTPVFNFRVEDFHTYFAAENPQACPILVHNANYGKWGEAKWFEWVSTHVEPKPLSINNHEEVMLFQARHCGPNEQLITATGTSYRADTIRGIELVDAKFATQSGRSPYRNELPSPVQAQIDSTVRCQRALKTGHL